MDTETNGLGGDACEMTEVGAVLVGGGELHDRWSSLVRQHAAPARDPALHRDHPGDGRRCAVARSGAAGAGAAAAGPGDGRPQRAVRSAGAAPGVRARRPGLAEPAGAVHGGAGAGAAAAAARAQAGRARRRARDRGRVAHRALADAETCGARAVRAVPAAVRERAHGRRGDRPAAPQAAVAAPPRSAPQAGAAARGRGRALPQLDFGELPERSRRVPVPRRRRQGAVRRQVGLDPQPRPGALRAVERPTPRGPRTRPSSTTRARTRSSARWCSRTG